MPPMPNPTLDAETEAVLRMLADASRRLGPAHSAARDHIGRAHALLSLVAPPVARGGLAAWQERQVLAYIDRSLDGPILIRDLADIARLSVRHFSEAFRTSVGAQPHAFITARRIARAKDLMRDSDDPLSEIAAACGLSDQSHLSRLFRRATGVSPNAWRRQHRSAR